MKDLDEKSKSPDLGTGEDIKTSAYFQAAIATSKVGVNNN